MKFSLLIHCDFFFQSQGLQWPVGEGRNVRKWQDRRWFILLWHHRQWSSSKVKYHLSKNFIKILFIKNFNWNIIYQKILIKILLMKNIYTFIFIFSGYAYAPAKNVTHHLLPSWPKTMGCWPSWPWRPWQFSPTTNKLNAVSLPIPSSNKNKETHD